MTTCAACKTDLCVDYTCDVCDAPLCDECITDHGGGGGGDIEWDGPDTCPDEQREECNARYEVKQKEAEVK